MSPQDNEKHNCGGDAAGPQANLPRPSFEPPGSIIGRGDGAHVAPRRLSVSAAALSMRPSLSDSPQFSHSLLTRGFLLFSVHRRTPTRCRTLLTRGAQCCSRAVHSSLPLKKALPAKSDAIAAPLSFSIRGPRPSWPVGRGRPRWCARSSWRHQTLACGCRS